MKNLLLVRWAYTPMGVFGKLFIEGSVGLRKEICSTLEPPAPGVIEGRSCIPTGPYMMQFKDHPLHGMAWEVLNVPGRTGILFHVGNTYRDTEGCILVGKPATQAINFWGIIESNNAYKDFLRELAGLQTIPLDIIYQPLYMMPEPGNYESDKKRNQF